MMMPNATAGHDRDAASAGPGPNLCIATACAAGANAIGEGARLIRDGTADVVVAGGTEARVTPLTDLRVRPHGRAEHPQRRSRARVAPVRRRPRRLRDGRGRRRSSCSSAASARWRAAPRIYGEVAGYGRNADAYHITAPSPGGAGAAACMQLALDDAGLDAADDRPRERARHVDAAQRRRRGRGDPQGVRRRRAAGHVDQGRHRPPDRRRRRGRGGRSRCSSMRDGVVPPTANLEQIGDDIDLDVVAGEPAADRAAPVLSNSFGFGGHNATLILAPADRPSPPGDRAARRRPSSGTAATAVGAEVRELDGRSVSWFRLDGGKHRGAIGTAEGETIERAVRLAVELGIPLVGRDRQLGRRRQRGRRRRSTRGAASPRRWPTRRAWCPIVLAARRALRVGPRAAARASPTTWS